MTDMPAMSTQRPTVPALEDMLGKTQNVLDHGFVRVIDYMGDDSAIVQAARVSYGKGTKQVNQDRGLIRYLMRHWHSTPFEMCELKLHVKLPIFVARQWIRHRTANVNEYSARYSVLDREFYIPESAQLATQSTQNNQGRGDELSAEQAQYVMNLLQQESMGAYQTYETLLNGSEQAGTDGISRELARMSLSLNYYTQWYWKIDLHNLMHFLRLRADHHAQYEIRVYADLIAEITKAWLPITYEAFEDYRLGAASLSRQATEIINLSLANQPYQHLVDAMSQREWQDICYVFPSLENKNR